MKIYLIQGHGVNVVENATEPIAIICQTPEQVDEQINFIIDEARQWAKVGWDFPLKYQETISLLGGVANGYKMSVEYDIRDPKQKSEWLQNPTLDFAGISPDDFQFTEKSQRQYDRSGIKTANVVSVSVKEIEIQSEQ